MCGRYFFQLDENLPEFHKLRKKLYDHTLFDFREGEVFPTQDILVLKADGPYDYRPCVMKWGIHGPKKSLLINARREGIAKKYTFRPLLKNRCVVTANGFYEWVKHGSQKDKIYIQKQQQPLIYFAGLYNQDGEVVIVTGASMHEMANIHDRTPIMMNEAQMMAYLYDERAFEVDNEALVFQKV